MGTNPSPGFLSKTALLTRISTVQTGDRGNLFRSLRGPIGCLGSHFPDSCGITWGLVPFLLLREFWSLRETKVWQITALRHLKPTELWLCPPLLQIALEGGNHGPWFSFQSCLTKGLRNLFWAFFFPCSYLNTTFQWWRSGTSMFLQSHTVGYWSPSIPTCLLCNLTASASQGCWTGDKGWGRHRVVWSLASISINSPPYYWGGYCTNLDTKLQEPSSPLCNQYRADCEKRSWVLWWSKCSFSSNVVSMASASPVPSHHPS